MKTESFDFLRTSLTLALLLALSLGLFAPVMRHAIQVSPDYENHYRRAMELPAQTTNRAVGHVLYHAVVKVYRGLLPAAAGPDIQLISVLSFMLPLCPMIFLLLKRSAGGTLPDKFTGALALGLALAAPVTFWVDNKFMIGYVTPIVYHSPTYIALRPFVIPLSLLALLAVQERGYRDLNQRLFWLLAAAALMMLTTLSKPSYTIALLPALILYAIRRRLRGCRGDFVFLLWGLCIPGGIILALEYLYTFAAGFRHGGTIAFGPLIFMDYYIPAWRIPIQVALSLVFPAGVCLLYVEEARKCQYIKLSWLVMAIGCLYLFTLYQDGGGLKSGNFVWTAYSAIFVLMFASLTFLIEQHKRERKSQGLETCRAGPRLSPRVGVGFALFALHVLSGIAYWHRFFDYV